MFPQGSPADPPLASQTRPAPFRGRAGFLRPSRGFPRQAATPQKAAFPAGKRASSETPPLRRAIARGRKAVALAPCDRPGAGRPSPLCRALPGRLQACPPALREALLRRRKAAALAPRDFLGPKGLRPRATRLPRAERPPPLRRALPGRVRACPPALREALLRRRKAAALAPRASRRVAGMSASLARGAPGRRKAAALAPHDCPGAGNRRPRAAQMPGGRKAVALAPALPGGRGRTGCVHSPFAPAWDAAPGMGGA